MTYNYETLKRLPQFFWPACCSEISREGRIMTRILKNNWVIWAGRIDPDFCPPYLQYLCGSCWVWCVFSFFSYGQWQTQKFNYYYYFTIFGFGNIFFKNTRRINFDNHYLQSGLAACFRLVEHKCHMNEPPKNVFVFISLNTSCAITNPPLNYHIN